jgi:hypothetical protein
MYQLMKVSNVGRLSVVVAGVALVAAVSLPAAASAATAEADGAASGGSAVITGGEGTRVIVDDTVGGGRLRTTEKVGGGV